MARSKQNKKIIKDSTVATADEQMSNSSPSPSIPIEAERQLFADPQRTTNFRFILLAFSVGYFFQKSFRQFILPYGPAARISRGDRTEYSSIDWTNDSLKTKHGRTKRIYERLENGDEPLMKGAETVVFGKDGTMYVLTEEANLLSLTDFEDDEDGVTITAKADVVKDLGAGRPLGAKFTMDGKTLYIADTLLGLTRVQNVKDPTSKVEIVASGVMDGGRMSKFLYTDDVCVGPKTGKIYFSDASTVVPDRIKTDSWDTLYASKIDLARGVGTGRILEYDPSTDQVSVLATGFRFANGIAVSKDESYVFFVETFGIRLWKYHLKGEKKGELEVVADSKDMTGYLDGADCDWSKPEKCYAVMPSAIVPMHKLWNMLPEALDVLFRTFLMSLPRTLAPSVKSYGAILEVDSVTKEVRYIQDPSGEDISMITGVTVHRNKLYLGSLKNAYIGVYTLD
jgi:sugar lactone lactonase YvrE